MSISTGRGDGGDMGLGGGCRVSKADARVEAYGAIDELYTVISFARTQCHESELNAKARKIQREFVVVGSAISTKPVRLGPRSGSQR